ncbi:MAG: AbrB/MazE/SpoVT family DNA-binding domain-containing protein [Novosphingobium sp.]
MNTKAKLIKVGNSTGIIIPKEVLTRLRVSQGDELHFAERANGEFTVGKYDPDFARAMELAEEIMHEDRDILRVLAK